MADIGLNMLNMIRNFFPPPSQNKQRSQLGIPIYYKMLRIDRKFSSLLSRRQQTTVEDRKEMWYCYYILQRLHIDT